MRRTRLLPLLTAGLIVLAGCGDSTAEPLGEPSPEPPSTPAGDAEAAAEVDAEGDPAGDAAPATPDPAEGETGADAAELAFTFTGETGPDGCRYEGPATLSTGSYPSTLTNTSTEHFAIVNVQRLAEGFAFDDFLDYLAELGDDYPVVTPPEHDNPRLHDWLDGDWRSVHEAAPGETHALEGLTLPPGRLVAFCWTDDERGAAGGVWPAAALEVAD
jgi:hypothetical protein